ncbi:C-X-C motif chemokine 10-like [Leptodactylus fuscus]|uniref:C-X-C motif chemokine 10-like n=1 Tax=Leptodactylus fuscus TaxID=238119 RepID=UPI003F4F060C
MELHMLLLFSWLPIYITMSSPVVLSRCRCINTATNIRPKLIENIEVIQPSSSCENTEIIITVQSARRCLNPNTKLGRIIMKCWNRVKAQLEKDVMVVQREEMGNVGRRLQCEGKQCVKDTWKKKEQKNKRQSRKKRKSKRKQQ